MISTGKLIHRVVVQQRTTTQDGYGQQLDTWVDMKEVSANIKPIGGREKLRSMAINATLTHTVAVRFSAMFMPPLDSTKWRIKYGTRIFNIVATRDVDEENRFIIFDCTEGSVDGQ